MEPEKAVRLWGYLDNHRSNFRSLWDEITKYVLPAGSWADLEVMPGERRMGDVYDSTAVQAAEDLANEMASALTNPAMPWIDFEFDDDQVNRLQRARDWLDRSRDVLSKHLLTTNFYEAMTTAFMSAAALGTVGMIGSTFRPRDGRALGMAFEVPPPHRFAFTVGHDMLPETRFLKFELPAEAAASKLEKFTSDWRPSPKMAKLLESKDPADHQKAVAFIGVYEWVDGGQVELSYVHVEDRFLMAKKLLDSMPFPIARWKRRDEDAGWGRSAAMSALPTIRQVNDAEKDAADQRKISMRPPLQTRDAGVVGMVDARPNAINYLRGDAELRTLFPPVDPRFNEAKSEQDRQAIRAHFQVDDLRLIMEGRPAQMTASEFHTRVEMIMRRLGPPFSAIERELIAPIVMWAFQELAGAGLLPAMPPELLDRQASVTARFRTPLSRAQEAAAVAPIAEVGVSVSQMAAALNDRTLVAHFDGDKAVRRFITGSPVPAEVLRPADQVQGRKEELAAVMAAQMAAGAQ